MTVTKIAELHLAYENTTYVKDATHAPSTNTFEDPTDYAATATGQTAAIYTETGAGVPVYTTVPAISNGVCRVDPATGVATMTGAGECTVQMYVPTNGHFLSNTISTTFTIAKAQQQPLQFNNAATTEYSRKLVLDVTQPNTVNPIADLPATELVYEVVSGEGCMVAGATLFTGQVGDDCVVMVTRPGNDNFLPVSKTQTVTTTKIAMAPITVSAVTSLGIGMSTTLNSSGGSGDGLVSYDIVNGAGTICSIDSATNKVTAIAAGTCTVKATKQASRNYKALAGSANLTAPLSSTDHDIVINKTPQRVDITSVIPMYPVKSTATLASTYKLTAVASSGLPVAYSVTTASAAVCEIAADTVKFLADGVCEVEAAQSGNNNFYAATPATQTITVGALNQTIMFEPMADLYISDASPVVAPISNSGLPVALSLGDHSGAGVCSVSATGLVTMLDAGICEIKATQAGTTVVPGTNQTVYLPATPVLRSFRVFADLPGSPMITSVSTANRAVTATFTIPSYNGGSPITAYELIATPVNGVTAGVVRSSACAQPQPVAGQPASYQSCSLYGLVNETEYTLTVSAINSVGTGLPATAAALARTMNIGTRVPSFDV